MGKDTVFDGGKLTIELARAGMIIRGVTLDLTPAAADALQGALSGIDGLVAPGEITGRLADAISSIVDCRHAKPGGSLEQPEAVDAGAGDQVVEQLTGGPGGPETEA